MKRIQLSLIVLITSSNLAMAGGDIIAPVEFYEDTTTYEAIESLPIETASVVEEVTPIYDEPVIIEEESLPVFEPMPIKEESVSVVAPIVVEEPTPIKEPMPLEIKEPKPIKTPVSIANADVSGFYAGLGLVAARYDTNCVCNGKKSDVDKTAGIVGRVGYDFNPYIGVEGRGLLTNQKGDNGEIEHVGLFLKPMYPVSDATNIYALVGLGKTKTKGSLRRTDVEGLAFGAGIEYDLSEDRKKDAKYDREFDGQGDQEKGLGLFADYERLYYKSGSPDLDTISAGITYDF